MRAAMLSALRGIMNDMPQRAQPTGAGASTAIDRAPASVRAPASAVSASSTVPADIKPSPASQIPAYAAGTKLGMFGEQMPTALRRSVPSHKATAMASAGKSAGASAGVGVGVSSSTTSQKLKEFRIKDDKIFVVLDRGWLNRPLTPYYKGDILDGHPGHKVIMPFKVNWSAEELSSAVVDKVLEEAIHDFRPKPNRQGRQGPSFEWAKVSVGSGFLVTNGAHDKYNGFDLRSEYGRKHCFIVLTEDQEPDPIHADALAAAVAETDPEGDPFAAPDRPQDDDLVETTCCICATHWPRNVILTHEKRCAKNPAYAARKKPVAYKGNGKAKQTTPAEDSDDGFSVFSNDPMRFSPTSTPFQAAASEISPSVARSESPASAADGTEEAAGPTVQPEPEVKKTRGSARRPRHCICGKPDNTKMICCDSTSRVNEWFHYDCVVLPASPAEMHNFKWFCPQCALNTDHEDSMDKEDS
ncbi:unnamed protein product [Tilletia laevis]|nr:hypothetical protein CF336_g4650 [Tilletia laevis]KAE8196004.1 hypothetical protein CF328_g4273 [Tilletia controversa]KAE8259698.1 hypothetical protein A4X03_0g4025 [Tilletia caries]CAD6884664.1 unnamed protein product [Tilletia caries]CAD6908506.1 unnamed protein product [Tilletia laevis]